MVRVNGCWVDPRGPTRNVGWASVRAGLLCAGMVSCQCRTATPHRSQGRDVAVANLSGSSQSAPSTSAPVSTAPPTSAQASTSATMKPYITVRTVDLSKCPVLQNDQEGEDGIARCVLGSDLVAQQDYSACFSTNRLLYADGESLFTSEMIPPADSVFVTDDKFELYSCSGRPIAVLQGGRLFPEGPTVESPCYAKTLLRRAYFVKDIRNDRQYDDVSLARARTILSRIVEDSPCRMKP